MKIPKIIHRIWLGNKDLPLEYEAFWRKWKALHPDWSFIDWRDNDISVLSLYPLINQVKSLASASDIARYEILFLYGGVYLDCDFDCKKPIDKLLEKGEFIVCNQSSDFQYYCSNGFFASVPGHPILEKAIKELQETKIETINDTSPANITGPYFFRRIINNSSIEILKSCTFYPYMHARSDLFECDSDDIYGIHVWGESWLEPAVLLWKAALQYRNGSLRDSIDTCRKISDESYKLKRKKLISRAERRIRIRQILYPFTVKPFLALVAYFAKEKELRKILRSERELGSNTSRESAHAPEPQTKGYKLRALVRKIIKKSLSVTIVRLQYAHILDFLFESEKNIIVEVGAMDGKSFDKLYPYIKTSRGTTALFVEPLKDSFQTLRQNYTAANEDTPNQYYFENAAVTAKPGKFNITRIPLEVINSKGLPDWTKGIASINPEKNALFKDEKKYVDNSSLRQFSIQEEIQGVTFEFLLKKYNLKDIDILQIDTEGYDYIVLSQALHLTSPRLICFEWANLSEKEKILSLELLKKHKYLTFLTPDSYDMIACDRGLYDEISSLTFSNHSVVLSLFPRN